MKDGYVNLMKADKKMERLSRSAFKSVIRMAPEQGELEHNNSWMVHVPG